MPDDIFDTRFEGKEMELDDNRVIEGEDVNLLAKDPTLRSINLAMGWVINTFDVDTVDLDVSLFLLNKKQETRVDDDFIFYNQPEALNGQIKHGGDSRTGAGEGDDERIFMNLNAIPFEVIQIPVVLSIYKGYEKEQSLQSIRSCYLRIMNAETDLELLRFELNDLFKEREETAAIIGWINREGPKWHFKAELEYIAGGLSEIARRYGILVNQE